MSAVSSSSIDFSHFASPFSAGKAAPRITVAPSPSNLYLFRSSRTSISTRSSISGSSTASHLFKNTTMWFKPTWRANNTCSRVCGITLSNALTTRIAPSICAAPVIMFLM